MLDYEEWLTEQGIEQLPVPGQAEFRAKLNGELLGVYDRAEAMISTLEAHGAPEHWRVRRDLPKRGPELGLRRRG